jgi:hypothetical protein
MEEFPMRPEAQQQTGRLHHDGRDHALAVIPFDYAAAAELFAGTSKKGSKSFSYNRFDSAAEALRFAVEDAPPHTMLSAYLEVDEARFDFAQIRMLYANARYPLRRADMPADGDSRTNASSQKMQNSKP